MAENNAMNVRIVDGDDCCPQAMCVKVCNLVQEVRKTGASKKLIPSEKAVSDALKGRQELLVAGAAEGILGPSAATGLAQVLTAPSAGVSIVDAIKGRTLKWNQLVDDDTETVTVPSGHKYFALIGGVASVATSDGTALSVTGGTDNVIDLTDYFGAGNEPSTVAEFTALFPNFPYAYNAGTLLPFKGTALKVKGFNQWDEQWEANKTINPSTGAVEDYSGTSVSKNHIPVLPSTTYYLKNGTWANRRVAFYREDKSFISLFQEAGSGIFNTPADCRYILFYWLGTTYNRDICINISNASLNGTYKPYTETLVNIDAIGKSAKDADGNAIVPFPAGMHGVGTAYDKMTRIGGEIEMKEVDLSSFDWSYDSGAAYFAGRINDIKPVGSAQYRIQCAYYSVIGKRYNGGMGSAPDMTICQSADVDGTTKYVYVKNTAYTNATTFKTAMAGVKLVYELAAPVPFTWDEPFTLAFTAEEGGTIWLQPEGVDEAGVPVSAPLNADIAYTVPAGQVINATTLDNLLDALKTAGVISAYTMTPDGNGNYTFTITA